MKVAAIAPNPAFSGAERVLLRYLTDLRDDGATIRVAAPPGPLADELAAAGHRTDPLTDLAVPTGPRLLALLRLALRWPRAACRVRAVARDADVVVVNGFLALPAVALARVRPPVVWLVHDVVHKSVWLALLRVCRGALARGLAVSEAAAAPLRTLGIDVVVVRNGTPWPVEPAVPQEPPVIGVNAALTSWKGQDVLLEALSTVRGVRVQLLGSAFPRDREFVAALRARAEQPDLRGRVEFLGWVPDPQQYMRTWTVAVSASVAPEAASLSLLEAMSLGLPVVATAHGGTPEVLGGAGLFVPPGDAPAMADALCRLLQDPDLRASCGAAGRDAVAAGLRYADASKAFASELSAARR